MFHFGLMLDLNDSLFDKKEKLVIRAAFDVILLMSNAFFDINDLPCPLTVKNSFSFHLLI